MNKRGQIALFVIIAVLLIAAIAVMLIAKPKIPFINPEKIDVQSYVEKCVSDEVQRTADILSVQGGLYNPEFYLMYKGNKTTYLCYTSEFYKPCVNQQVYLQGKIENEIKDRVNAALPSCLSKLKSSLVNKGYDVQAGNAEVGAILIPDNIIININTTFAATKGDETQRFEKFIVSVPSPLFRLINYADEIVRSEIRMGDFDDITFAFLHRDTRVYIDRVDYDTVYTLKHVESGKRFIFAVRSYVLPEGYRLA